MDFLAAAGIPLLLTVITLVNRRANLRALVRANLWRR
jgi:hypothetical protein